VGLVVLDRDYNVKVWNSFMENHSGMTPGSVISKNIFNLFSDLPVDWFKRKLETVFLLNNRGFTIWEQRPYLFRFKNYRPITSTAEFMYQNATLIPLLSVDGKVNHVGIIIYDVTSVAINSQRLKQANQQLEHLSRTDRLTRLFNRGYWEECLKQEYNRIRRTGVVSSLVIFDIDHFKSINDSYGHQAGDDVIRATARKLMDTQRSTDISGRYGGEEFVIILIDTREDGALYFAERLRNKIEAMTIEYDNNSIKYTVSLGIAEYRRDLKDYSEWLGHADRALYEAKESGRNRTVIYEE
jgi:diguanylate cyclase (GGDEF)-like protein